MAVVDHRPVAAAGEQAGDLDAWARERVAAVLGPGSPCTATQREAYYRALASSDLWGEWAPPLDASRADPEPADDWPVPPPRLQRTPSGWGYA